MVGADDPKTWAEVLDGERIDRTVIYPTAALGVGYIQDPEWAVVACRAYNDMMSARYLNLIGVSERWRSCRFKISTNPQENSGAQ